MLHEFIVAHRGELIEMARDRGTGRKLGPAREIGTGVPLLLDQIVQKLLHPLLTGSFNRGATIHGATLHALGYTLAEVVHEYGDVGQVIALLLGELNVPVMAEETCILQCCLSDATAVAVMEHARLHDREVSHDETQRAGMFAHELRNKLGSAQLAFQSIKAGKSPVAGGVSAVVSRGLLGMEHLISRSIVDTRIDSGTFIRRRTRLCQFMDEAQVSGSLAAQSRGLSLDMGSTAHEVDVDVDPEILGGVLANLLQNAFKFTPQGGRVLLRTSVIDSHVLIDVTDGCGGLPAGKPEELFDAFAQRGQDRSGLGLGLLISRKGAEASGGRLRVKDLPGMGCTFTIDLPQLH